MFNVIVTDKYGNEYYVGSDASIVEHYDEDRAFIYEFEDYEDANNIVQDFMECSNWYGYEIEVIQM